jgi:hypothetical protein
MNNTEAHPIKIDKAISLLEIDLKINEGFLANLKNEDDWSFVIKSHAFLEAALSHLLSQALSEPALHDVFSNIETSNTKSGKLAFIKQLNLLDDNARRFIRSFSELRNSLVHDIGQVGFSFDQHIQTFDKQKKDNFVKSFGYFANGENFELDEQIFNTRDFMLMHQKLGAWYSVLVLCAVIYITKDDVKALKIIKPIMENIISSFPKRGI